jgi:hypothetical protein
VVDHPAGGRQAEGVYRAVHLTEERAAAHPGHPGIRINEHPVHRPQIDHHAALGR